MSLKWMLLLLALIVGRAGDCFCVTALEAKLPDGAWPYFAKKPLTQPE